MFERWKSREWIVGSGARMTLSGGTCWIFGVVFAILGVIGDAMDATLGLESISWFLLAIASFVAAISWYLGWVLAVYRTTKDAKNKE